MVPTPMTLGLTLCHYVSVEEGTRNISLIGSFLGFRAADFPFTPAPFYVYAPMIGGQGHGKLELRVTNLQTEIDVFTVRRQLGFPDRFTEVRAVFRLSTCAFPDPGNYLMTLLVDGEWVAQRRFHVASLEASS